TIVIIVQYGRKVLELGLNRDHFFAKFYPAQSHGSHPSFCPIPGSSRRGRDNLRRHTRGEKSMRKWIIVGVVLLLLCVAGVVAVLNVNSYIARNKDYLISQAEQALGRKVSVDDVEVSLWNGIGFRLTNLSMSDHPAFSSAELFSATDMHAK